MESTPRGTGQASTPSSKSSPSPSRLPLPAAIAVVDPVEFVGRGPELARLRAAWTAACNGRPGLVFLAGEPGIGKTRLATELARAAYEDGATILLGRCDEELLAPYQPFVEAIRQYVGAWPAAERGRRLGRLSKDLVRLIPELGEDAVVPAEPLRSEAESERYRLFEAVTSLLTSASADAPLMLLLEDVHWADKPTLLLLRHLARNSGDSRFLVVATYRDSELSPSHALADALADLRREQLGERLLLGGLTVADVAALLAAETGAPPDDKVLAFAGLVHRETEGNPFFVTEVLRHVAERGFLGADATNVLDLATIGIPEGVKEVLGRRLARLSEMANNVLTMAAVIGRAFELRLLELVSDLPGDIVLDALEEAAHARIVEEVRDVVGCWTFSHSLIRQTLYGQLSTIRRVRLHARVGEALEQLTSHDVAPRLAELAYHFVEAATGGDVRKAVDYASRAGHHALAQLAYEEAAGHFERALEVLAEGADDRQRNELLLALGDAQWRAGDQLGARETFQHAAAMARRLGDAGMLARAALGYGTGLGGFGRSVRANKELIALLEEALDAVGDLDSVLRVRLLSRLGVELYYTPFAERRARLSQDAVEMAERLGDRAAFLVALYCREWANLGPDVSLEERLAATDEIIALARELGDAEVAYQGHFLRRMALVEAGRIDEVDDETKAAARIAEEARIPSFLPWIVTYESLRAWLHGDIEEAERLAQTAMAEATSQQADPEPVMLLIGGQLMVTRLYRSGMEEIVETVERMAAEYPEHAVMRCVIALAYRDFGDLDAARNAFRAVAAAGFETLPRDASWLLCVWALSLACAYVDDREHAAELYELLLPYRDRWITSAAAMCFGPARTALGALAGVLGRHDEGVAHLDAALAELDALPAPVLAADARVELATLLLGRGGPDDRERARAVLDEAAETAARLGLDNLAARAARALEGAAR